MPWCSPRAAPTSRAQFPFGVVRQLFEPVLSEALLAGAARQAAPVFSSAGAATEMGTLHGLYWLTANLCEQPAVLVVDDLHWADAASLRFLVHLANRLDGLPLLVAAAARAGSRGVDPELYDRAVRRRDRGAPLPR